MKKLIAFDNSDNLLCPIFLNTFDTCFELVCPFYDATMSYGWSYEITASQAATLLSGSEIEKIELICGLCEVSEDDWLLFQIPEKFKI